MEIFNSDTSYLYYIVINLCHCVSDIVFQTLGYCFTNCTSCNISSVGNIFIFIFNSRSDNIRLVIVMLDCKVMWFIN